MFFSMCSVCVCCFYFFFFFKQKTAYEMRISDWSSDVCSSDLRGIPGPWSMTLVMTSSPSASTTTYRSAAIGVLEGVRQQVGEHADGERLIGGHRSGAGLDVEDDGPGRVLPADELDLLLHALRPGDLASLDGHGAGVELGGAQERVDERLEALLLAQHDLVDARPVLGGELGGAAGERVQEPLDRGEGGPQLVGHLGDPAVLVVLELLARRLVADVGDVAAVGERRVRAREPALLAAGLDAQDHAGHGTTHPARDRKSTRLNYSHSCAYRMPSSA